MSTHSQADYRAIADKNGVELDDVRPLSHSERLEKLTEIVKDESVPYPIPVEQRDPYIAHMASGQPFGVGEFGGAEVDLKSFANHQVYETYTFEEHLSWACLVAQQRSTKAQYACREYLEGEAMFEIQGGVIPDFYILNARIYQQTGWQLATVKEIIPAELFFTCHSLRYFPVTTFMRPLGTDYLQEPDIGHDVAGHVATFTIPEVAEVMRNHGDTRNMIYARRDEQIAAAKGDPAAIAKIQEDADALLTYAGRIYWFTVEFGLVMQEGELRDFGAGILSSPGETVFSIESREPNRILVDPSDDGDLLRLANTDYLISEFQKTYFVSQSFKLLASLTPERLLAASEAAMALPDFTWRELIPGDKVLDVGRIATSPNEKYYRLMAGQTQDECLTRAALKNLQMFNDGVSPELMAQFSVPPPDVPQDALQWFRERADTVCPESAG